MKKHFLTGLATILPLVVTILVVDFFITLLTKPFLGLTKALPFPLNQLLILFVLCCFVLLVGFLGQWLLLEPLFHRLDRLMHRIPFISKIYKAVQELMHILFGKERLAFSKVALVPYFDAHSLGFVAHENLMIKGQKFTSVYVLGAPNPMMGFILLLPEGKITPLSLSIEEATKLIISCGVARSDKKLA